MVSVMYIKNSKSKNNKHIKRGRKGKDCMHYNKEKKTCNRTKSFCKSNGCEHFKTKKEKRKPNGNNVFVPLPQKVGTHEKTNEYIGISRNIGTPCHVGYIKSNEPRRHKSRCIYYKKDTKFCNWYKYKCVGSSQCEEYEEIEK